MHIIVRAALPQAIHNQLKHLSVDLKKPVQELLVDGAILLLRFHDRGAGLPEPVPPSASKSVGKKGGAR